MPLYLPAILPPPFLSEEIDEIRKEISLRYDVYLALKPPVHLTIYRPSDIPVENESRLIKLLDLIAAAHTPFFVQLQNFDSFNNKTLFIHCEKNEALNRLQRHISTSFRQNGFGEIESNTNSRFHPYITLAYRDVGADTFKQLWKEFKNRKLKRKFDVNCFHLLKHNGKQWEVLKEFSLKKTEELSLF